MEIKRFSLGLSEDCVPRFGDHLSKSFFLFFFCWSHCCLLNKRECEKKPSELCVQRFVEDIFRLAV